MAGASPIHATGDVADCPPLPTELAMRQLMTSLRGVLLGLVTAGLLAGCGTLVRPFGKGADTVSGTLLYNPPPVAIVTLDGPPGSVADRIAAYVASEAARRGFEVVRKPPTKHAFRVEGTLSAAKSAKGVAVAYVWDVTDAIGAAHHRIAGEEIVAGPAKGKPWKAVDDAAMLRIGQYTAEGLAGFLGRRGYNVRNIALPPPASIAAGPAVAGTPQQPAHTQAKAPETGTVVAEVAVPAVSGSDPGSGKSLAAAMQAALARHGVRLAPAPGPGTLKVAGSVSVGPSRSGQQPVSIVWKVLDRKDELVGDVKQNNNVPVGTLDGGWAPVAKLIADAAAEGVVKLLVKAR